ncbi:serine/threonine-protein kinase [Hydrogenophaga sp.]|uniref:serine/threonine-protein kinase n=1 Tax=Hydrogenophaga sp. TaxID=1904254 RepID=UPI002718B9C6|nr:serine/threonine-protein kinase [Hydrogenophaga sp.]MDO9504253.1 serine/threonine-protein kinase [Hydrogenophaga sp.]
MSPAQDLGAAAADLCQKRGFEFLGELGKGAFKSAYLAKSGPTPFALKLAAVTGSPERLIREAVALQGCSHLAIATLYEAFPHTYGSVQLWVVCEEYLAGGTLEARLTGGLPTPSELRRIAVILAEVLEHLNDKRLVHRDIKPANIMFRADGAPVLTDFGIVRMLDQPTLTHAFLNMGPGTPAYAAPEQLTNDKALIDWRTDQFGLAIVLAECLLGHHPFAEAGRTIHDAILSVAAKQEIPAANARRLEALGFGCLTKALKPWPIARYRRPSEFIESLKQP